jgi:hypothetical protein
MDDDNKASLPDEDVTPKETSTEDQVEVEMIGQASEEELMTEKKQIPRWLRIGLIGLGVVIVLFFAGFLTDHFTRFIPLQQTFDTKSQQAIDLEKQVSTLTNDLAAANDEITQLKSDQAGLQSNLDASSIHVELLSAINELQAAQIALENDDVSGAKVALQSTPKRLENLKAVIAPLDASLADNVSDRMKMILSDLDKNTSMASSNLSLLISNLLNIETLLYK